MAVFSDQLAKFAEKVGLQVDQVVREVSFKMAESLVLRSPVGNPDLWKANRGAAYQRETYNLFAGAINASAGPGEKRIRKMGKRNLQKTFPNVAGKGYTGGRFRGNWVISTVRPSTEITDEPDPSGSATLGRIRQALGSIRAGGVVYLSNSMPYARKIEYGHSRQAPAGVVRITVVEFKQYIAEVLKK